MSERKPPYPQRLVDMAMVNEKNQKGLPRAFLLASSRRADVAAEAQRLRPVVEKHVEVVLTDFTGTADLSSLEADLAIVFGGDGSVLRAAHQMGERQLPVVAVNLGRLGFLTNVSPEELPTILENFARGKLAIVEHLMFDCSILRAGEVLSRHLGLNETVIHAGTPFSLIDIDLYIDADLVTTYRCDGLIISTPVGSTAHSLSAGGPILRKDLQAFVVVPLSPHTLTNRPLVDSADCVYEMVVEKPSEGTTVVVDGQVVHRLQAGDRVRVSRAKARFKQAANPGHTYYRSLREKLGWGGRLKLDLGAL